MSTIEHAGGGRGRSPAPWLYLFGVLAWSWTWFGFGATADRPVFSLPTVVLYLLGGLGPVIVPALLIFAGFWDSRLDASASGFFRRAYDPRTISGRWFLYLLGLVAALVVLPVLLDTGTLQVQGPMAPGSAAMLLVGVVGGILEEPGWRGYAQEGLQRRMPVLTASLVIGVFWALWHLPLFFMEGTYQADLGWGTPAFWGFHLAIIAGCPVYAWMYNVAGGADREGVQGRAIFAAVLYHGAGNVGRELVPDVSELAEVGVEVALTLIVVGATWDLMKGRRGASGDPGGRL